MQIFPSLISSDLLNLEKTIKEFDPFCSGYHIDIMDDHFVPNLTWGSAFANAINKKTSLSLHIHLMVDDPYIWIERLNLKKEDVFIFHIESINSIYEIEKFIKKIKNKNCKVGIALKPDTDIFSIFNYLKFLDHVLIMSVEPGFSGQKFLTKVVEKINPIVQKRREDNLKFKIGIDGGVNLENIKKLVELRVDQFSVASAIFSQKNPLEGLKKFFS